MKPPRDTPSYLIAFAVLGLLLYVAYTVGGLVSDQQERAERAEERNAALVGIIEDGRVVWVPQLDDIQQTVDALCAAEPECDPDG